MEPKVQPELLVSLVEMVSLAPEVNPVLMERLGHLERLVILDLLVVLVQRERREKRDQMELLELLVHLEHRDNQVLLARMELVQEHVILTQVRTPYMDDIIKADDLDSI